MALLELLLLFCNQGILPRCCFRPLRIVLYVPVFVVPDAVAAVCFFYATVLVVVVVGVVGVLTDDFSLDTFFFVELVVIVGGMD